MNSRKILYNRILAATLMLLAVALTPLYALAGEIETGPTVGFKQGTGAPALDPDDPGKPWGPIFEGEVRPEDGEQAIGGIFLGPAPSFDFGKNHSINDYSNTVYSLVTPQRPYVQVADLRGTGSGWTLSVKASSFVLQDEEGNPSKDKQGKPIKSLDGATIHLEKGTLNSSNTALLLDKNKRPTLNKSIEIACKDNGSNVEVMSAGKDQGMGAWIARWYPVKNDQTGMYDSKEVNSKVWLNVPQGSAESGQHKTTFTWTITVG